MNGTTLSKAFVPLPGGGTAVYGSSGISYYRHSDWLGSSRLASTPSRGLYSGTAYAPYGEQYATAGTADPSFTGQNSDTVSSLYDFTFRKQSPSQGRWISPDPAGLAAVDLTNPQSFNRYTYALNNPLTFTDPSGLNAISCFIFGIGCGGGDGGDGGSGGDGVGESDPCQGNYDTCVSVNGGDPNSCDFSDPLCQWTYGSETGNPGGFSHELGGGTGPNNASQITKQCVNEFYNSSFGKAVNFFSLGALVPGWGPNPLESLQQWGEAIIGKGGGGTALVYALNNEGTITTLSGTVSAGSNAIGGKILANTLHFLADAGTGAMGAATGIDVLIHAGCANSALNATGQANIPMAPTMF